MASTRAEVVEAIDPAKDRPAGNPIPVRGQPNSVAVGFGSIWVANQNADTVMRLDPGERPTPISIAVGDQPTDVAVDDRWVWVTNGGEHTVSRVDPKTNREDEDVQVGAGPRSVATGEGAVWVANIDGRSVSKIDPQEAITVDGPIELGQRPNDLAVGFGSVWVIDNFNATLTRIDPDALSVEGDPIEGRLPPAGSQDRLRLRLGRQRRRRHRDAHRSRGRRCGRTADPGRQEPRRHRGRRGRRLDRRLRLIDGHQDQALRPLTARGAARGGYPSSPGRPPVVLVAGEGEFAPIGLIELHVTGGDDLPIGLQSDPERREWTALKRGQRSSRFRRKWSRGGRVA